MIYSPFEYHLTPAETEEQQRWEKVQLDKEAQKRNKENLKISIGNIFKGKNNKTKLKGTNTYADHVRLYKACIELQRKNGRTFPKIIRYHTQFQLPNPFFNENVFLSPYFKK
jgi:hypothetical protein